MSESTEIRKILGAKRDSAGLKEFAERQEIRLNAKEGHKDEQIEERRKWKHWSIDNKITIKINYSIQGGNHKAL